MILVDSSVWIDHFRFSNATFAQLIADEQVLTHPVVIGELLLGGFPKGMNVSDLHRLPQVISAEDDEVLSFIQHHSLAGSGIGYGDAHLLASARLTPLATLWTRDRRLGAAARRLGLNADIEPYSGFQED